RHFQWTMGAILFAAYLTYAADALFFGVGSRFDELAYLIIPLFIGVILLSSRTLAILVVIDLLLVLLGGFSTISGASTDSLVSPLLGIAFASALALLLKRYLQLVEQDRKLEVSENESIFHGLITNVPVIIVVLDNEGLITLVEGKALEDINFDPSDFVGRSVYDTYADDPQLLQDCRRALAGDVFDSTLEMGGLVFDVWYSPLRTDDDKINGMIAVATDVTERRRAADVLQQQAGLLQSVSDAIISLDLNFNIETWNRAAEDVYGWLGYEVIGRPIKDIIETELPLNWESEALKQVTENGEWECELFQKQKDGVSICVLASFSQLENADGEIVGIIFVARDITQRKRAEQQSLDLALEREKIKLLKEFIGDSSHDFRTPLATIRTSAYLLRRKHPDITVKHLDVIDNEVDHLGHLVEDLLTLARLDRSPALEFAPVEINTLIETVLGPLHLLASDKEQSLTFKKGDPSFMVSGDSLELERVLVNVVTNAINYTPESGQIRVETAAADKSVRITIHDTGMGIAEVDLPLIFDRFFRVDKTRGSKTGGAGLGLPIAKKIIEAHKGKITVESTLGVGSTFVIQLPLMG
ncbi:MAG: PAS domain-containing sensor histidine kinase, partial [Chloroflexota bacterium]